MEVTNVLQAEVYDLSKGGKVSVIKNWFGRERLQFMQTLTNLGKEACKREMGLFNVLKVKFRQQHNEMILSLQYCILQRRENDPDRSGCVGSVFKQQNVITKNVIASSKKYFSLA